MGCKFISELELHSFCKIFRNQYLCIFAFFGYVRNSSLNEVFFQIFKPIICSYSFKNNTFKSSFGSDNSCFSNYSLNMVNVTYRRKNGIKILVFINRSKAYFGLVVVEI